jgi:hypothetical protein
LYVGGVFTEVNNQTQWGIANWSGNQWGSLGAGIDNISIGNRPRSTYAIVRYGSYMYFGGTFKQAGNLNTPAFARSDGTNWSSVPGALMTDPNDEIRDIIVNNNELYICGSFDSIGTTPANCIAKWDGITWEAIGNNYQFTTSTIQLNLFKVQIYNGNLYVIGNFLDQAGNTCRMAKWDGVNWIFFTNVFPSWTGLNDMEVYNNKLYVSGLFSIPGGKNGIMSWNDTTWSGVGGGVQVFSNPNPTVIDMCVHNGKLYCVGNFEKIGGALANGLATWDGTNWCGYDTDFRNNGQSCGATDIAFYNDTMYVGGGFQTADGDTVNYIVKWIGGNFVDTCGFISTGMSEVNQEIISLNVFPNPVSQIAVFEFHQTPMDGEIAITDQLGRKIQSVKLNGVQRIEFSVADLANGMYFYQYIENGQQKTTGKFIVQH